MGITGGDWPVGRLCYWSCAVSVDRWWSSSRNSRAAVIATSPGSARRTRGGFRAPPGECFQALGVAGDGPHRAAGS